MGLGTSWTVQNGGGQIFKPPGFHQYFAFFSLIRNGAMMGPPDLESTHKDASGDTHIIYFRQFQMCWNHPNNSPGSFDMDPKHHSNSPRTWAIHHITQWTWVRNTAHVQGTWSRSALDLGHIPRPSQVHLGWPTDTSLKSLLLVGTHIPNSSY